MDFKNELAAKAAEQTGKVETKKSERVYLTKGMTIVDMIKAMEPEIKKALP